MIRLLALGALLALAGCGSDPSEPVRVCAREGDPYYVTTRGGGGYYSRPCLEYRLACIQPLTLTENSYGGLVCKLMKPEETSK